MSITPVEGDEDRETQSGSASRSGVRARVSSFLGALGSRLREVLGRTRDQSRSTPAGPPGETPGGNGGGGQLRLAGQGRLESGREHGGRQEVRELPAHRGTDLAMERDGNLLRVYDPDADGAYVASDTWEPIER